jgi:hypothetical protein
LASVGATNLVEHQRASDWLLPPRARACSSARLARRRRLYPTSRRWRRPLRQRRGAQEQRRARRGFLDHRLPGAGAHHLHAVAARDEALLAARDAAEEGAARGLDEVVAAVRGDHLS